jgi:uncharacterized protein involved in response to NO
MPTIEISTRWYIFTSAPHRVMFFGGALQTIAVWWLIQLATRYGEAVHPLTICNKAMP